MNPRQRFSMAMNSFCLMGQKNLILAVFPRVLRMGPYLRCPFPRSGAIVSHRKISADMVPMLSTTCRRLLGVRTRWLFPIRSICRYVLYEVRLTLTYVSVAFVLTRTLSSRAINWITIARWFMEAYLIPCTLMTIASFHLGIGLMYFFDSDLKDFSPFIHTTKGSLFVLVRYAELHLSSRVNDYQASIFYHFCNELDLHCIPEYHHLQ